MKKFRLVAIILSLACLLSLTLTSCSLFGQDEGTKELEFELLPDGTYAVSAGNARDVEEIVIPAEYNGISVTAIDSHGFEGCSNIEKIIIPDSVTIIGSGAFKDCWNLVAILINLRSNVII